MHPPETHVCASGAGVVRTSGDLRGGPAGVLDDGAAQPARALRGRGLQPRGGRAQGGGPARGRGGSGAHRGRHLAGAARAAGPPRSELPGEPRGDQRGAGAVRGGGLLHGRVDGGRAGGRPPPARAAPRLQDALPPRPRAVPRLRLPPPLVAVHAVPRAPHSCELRGPPRRVRPHRQPGGGGLAPPPTAARQVAGQAGGEGGAQPGGRRADEGHRGRRYPGVEPRRAPAGQRSAADPRARGDPTGGGARDAALLRHRRARRRGRGEGVRPRRELRLPRAPLPVRRRRGGGARRAPAGGGAGGGDQRDARAARAAGHAPRVPRLPQPPLASFIALREAFSRLCPGTKRHDTRSIHWCFLGEATSSSSCGLLAGTLEGWT
mmetsp:Transcript_19155/g.41921  ORF Transcript_19155/g.41921 Transcript_19155/m.41921 type:complete len:378 (+) Transcript_19155:484-1617(+)